MNFSWRGQECLLLLCCLPGRVLQPFFGSFVKIMQVFIIWVWKPKRICTSTLQQWHRKGRGDCINPQPVMEVLVTKTSLELDKQLSSRGSGLKCLLYEARNSLKGQQASESKSLERLRELNPKMALSHIMTARTESTTLVLAKFGKSPQGSFASYQLSVTIQRATF